MSYEKEDLESSKGLNDPNNDNKNGSIAERLKMLSSKRTTRETSKRWGISVASLNAYINKGSVPSLERALTIANSEGVSLNWIATGEDEPQQASNYKEKTLITIPKYNVSASAGGGCYIDEEYVVESIEVSPNWLKHRNLTGKKLCIIRADGNSMEPSIDDGDDLLIDLGEIDNQKALEGVYVICIDDILRVKRLEYSIVDNGYRILSDNPLYKEELVRREELERMRVIGKVVMVMGKPARPPS